MVTAATTFGRSGVSDWLIQRFSGIILAAYIFFILGFILAHPGLDYATWKNLFSQLWVRIFSLAALLAVAAHAWIGLWAVITDYFTSRMLGDKALVLRVLILGVFALVTISYLVWGVQILWGIQ